jgi:chromosome segregation ATPase
VIEKEIETAAGELNQLENRENQIKNELNQTDAAIVRGESGAPERAAGLRAALSAVSGAISGARAKLSQLGQERENQAREAQRVVFAQRVAEIENEIAQNKAKSENDLTALAAALENAFLQIIENADARRNLAIAADQLRAEIRSTGFKESDVAPGDFPVGSRDFHLPRWPDPRVSEELDGALQKRYLQIENEKRSAQRAAASGN